MKYHRSDSAVDFFNKNSDRFHGRYSQSKVFQKRFQIWSAILNKYIKPDFKVLDIGCGSGVLSFLSSKKCSNVLGVDASHEMIDLCKSSKENSSKFNDAQFCMDKLPFSLILPGYKNSNLVILSSVLEYIDDWKKVIIDMHEILEEEGILVLSIPNENSFYRKCEKLIFNILRRPNYYKHVKNIFKIDDFNKFMANQGFKFIESVYFGSVFPEFVNKYLSNEVSENLFLGVYKRVSF